MPCFVAVPLLFLFGCPFRTTLGFLVASGEGKDVAESLGMGLEERGDGGWAGRVLEGVLDILQVC